jgi:hypothetical protein
LLEPADNGLAALDPGLKTSHRLGLAGVRLMPLPQPVVLRWMLSRS